MSITHNFTRGWSSNGDSLSKTISVTANGDVAIDMNIPVSTTGQLIAFTSTIANMQSIFMQSSADCTVKTNSAGSPINTFALAANIPYAWVTGDPAMRDTNGVVVTTNITALYAVNSSTANIALLEIRMLQNP